MTTDYSDEITKKRAEKVFKKLIEKNGININGDIHGQLMSIYASPIPKDDYVKFTYEMIQNHLMALSKNFYENGQQDKDLKLMTDFREEVQKAEEIIRSMLK